jgi:hypothetical protein
VIIKELDLYDYVELGAGEYWYQWRPGYVWDRASPAMCKRIAQYEKMK